MSKRRCVCGHWESDHLTQLTCSHVGCWCIGGYQPYPAGEGAQETHRCSGCGHRWEGELKGAELCGDCWRRAQSVVHAPSLPPERAALVRKLEEAAESYAGTGEIAERLLRAAAAALRGEAQPEEGR